MISLFAKDSDLVLSNFVKGAMKTGDSKHTAISLKNRLLAKKFRLGKSRAKLMNLSFSFFSMRAIVLLMYDEYPSAVGRGIFYFPLEARRLLPPPVEDALDSINSLVSPEGVVLAAVSALDALWPSAPPIGTSWSC